MKKYLLINYETEEIKVFENSDDAKAFWFDLDNFKFFEAEIPECEKAFIVLDKTNKMPIGTYIDEKEAKLTLFEEITEHERDKSEFSIIELINDLPKSSEAENPIIEENISKNTAFSEVSGIYRTVGSSEKQKDNSNQEDTETPYVIDMNNSFENSIKQIAMGHKYYFSENIPYDKLMNARSTMMTDNRISDREFIALIDTSLSGNAKGGILFFDGGCVLKNTWTFKNTIIYSDITNFTWRKKDLLIHTKEEIISYNDSINIFEFKRLLARMSGKEI